MPSRKKSESAGLAPTSGELVVVRRELQSGADLLRSAGPTSDFTYRVFEGLALDGTNFHRSLFTGSLVRGSTLRGVDFSRSDLDGFKAERSVFEDCSFKACDIRSSAFDSCSFTRCTFDEALIKDCTFDRCSFLESSIQRTVTSDNSFNGCTFTRSPLKRTSFIQNHVSASQFEEMVLGECSFMYVIFDGCTFERCAVNAESIGSIFGITEDDLKGFEILHSGQRLETPDSATLAQAFLFEYARRGWSLGVAIIRLNFRLTAELFAIHEYLEGVSADVEGGFLLKREELDFLARVMTELYAKDRLPLMAVTEALTVASAASHVVRDDGGASGGHAGRALRQFVSSLTVLLNESVDRIASLGITEADLSDQRPVTVTVVFEQKPSARMQTLLQRLMQNRLGVPGSLRLLEARRGSHVEVWMMPVAVMLMFNLLLISINASLARLTELRARLIVFRRTRPPKNFMDAAERPPRDASAVLDPMLKRIFSVAGAGGYMASPDLRGYGYGNIREMDIREPRPRRTVRRTRRRAPEPSDDIPKSRKKPRKRSSK